MEKHGQSIVRLIVNLWCFVRRCFFYVLAFGPMPNHIAFIMDGNRRYAKRMRLDSGHIVGFKALTSILQYCYEMGVKHVTVYAFSIDNFKRAPDEVQSLMDLMKEKIAELLKKDSIVNRYGFRIHIWGNLNLLTEPVRLAADKAMATTSRNKGPVLSVCVAYTSTHEIVHAIEKSCKKKMDIVQDEGCPNGHNNESVREENVEDLISVDDLEQNLFTADSSNPDIIIRTSGEARLSNFLLWQSTFSHLQNPDPLWPEFSLRHLVWAILEYQMVYSSLKERKSLSKKKL